IGIILGGAVAGGFVAAYYQPWPVLLVVAAATLMGLVGLWDDLTPVRWHISLGAQFVLFGTVAFALLPPLLALPAIIGGVLFINLFNFMDGIDGLAGTEAAFIFFAVAALAS